MLPYYINMLKHYGDENLPSVLNWLVPLSLIISLGAFVKNNEQFGYLIYIILFGIFVNIGKTNFFNSQKLRRNGYYVLGSLGTVFMLLLASFKWLWEDVFTHNLQFNSQEFYVVITLFCVSSSVLILSNFKKWYSGFNIFQFVFLIFSMLFFIGLMDTLAPTILVNALILILGILTVKEGIVNLSFSILNYGLLIISALILCRFFDTDMSFVVRGLLFVSVGFGFFFANYIILKKQKISDKNKNSDL